MSKNLVEFSVPYIFNLFLKKSRNLNHPTFFKKCSTQCVEIGASMNTDKELQKYSQRSSSSIMASN